MIMIRWKGVDTVISLGDDRRWVGPPDLAPILDAHHGPENHPTVDEQLAAVASRLGGSLMTSEGPADGSS